MEKKLLSALVLSLAVVATTVAQETSTEQGELKSYSFVEVQGGVQHPLGDIDFLEGLTPAVGFNIGHYFCPEAGFRLSAFGWQGQSEIESIAENYKWDYVSANLDLLINLTNLFSKNKNHALNLVFIGGIGLNYVWRSDDLDDIIVKYGSNQVVERYSWQDDRLLYNLHAGLRLDYTLTKHLGISVEALANNTSDRFNVKRDGHDDWQLTLMAGINFRFGHKYKKKTVVPPTPAPVVVEEIAPVVQAPKTLREQMTLTANETGDIESAKISRAARFSQENPGSTFVVKSYADAASGTPALNKKYALQRASEVKEALIKQGVPESQITVYLADTTGIFNKDKVTAKEEIFYGIRATEPADDQLARIAQFVADNPGATIIVKSYADAGTGNSEINAKYAEQRANSAKDALVSKGVSEQDITVNSYGDTVQPYAENDKNRVTIVEGTGYRSRILIVIEATTAQ